MRARRCMKAVVLVGGEGTRLRPLTLSTPKTLLPVAGRPVIERVVEHLAEHGVDEVVLSLGYKPDALLAAYPDGRCGPVKLHYAIESTPLDTAGAIAFAAGEAGIGDETFIVVNGDVLTEIDVSALLEFHRAAGRGGLHRPDTGRGPVALRCGVGGRQGLCRRVRREAAGRRSSQQHDQRRDLRAGARVPRAGARWQAGIGGTRDFPRPGRGAFALRPRL